MSSLNDTEFLAVLIGSGRQGTVADTKLIFSRSLELGAAYMILIHNHPSGNTKPRTSDINHTNNLVKAGKSLDLPVLDHVIIASISFTTLSYSGLIWNLNEEDFDYSRCKASVH